MTIIGICSLIEGAFVLSDLGLLDPPTLRSLGYQYGGFWPGLLRNWQPNYPGQPTLMFVTYAFLHGGPVHLLVNMITLYSLGRAVVDRVGRLRFLALYIASALAGAAGYAALSNTSIPMVGASGALFGLAGAYIAWGYVDRFTARERLWPIAQAVFLLILLNLVLWWAMDGQLAWQTHLGGFVGGWIMAMLLDPRSRVEPPV